MSKSSKMNAVSWMRLPPFIWGALLMIGAGVRFLQAAPGGPPLNLFSGGAVIAAAGLWLCYCLFSFRMHHTSPDPRMTPQNLITDGPFRLSRNPIYLGMALLMAGIGILLAGWIFVVTTLLFVLLVTLTNILPEERVLEACYGDAYLRYKKRVRRWL